MKRCKWCDKILSGNKFWLKRAKFCSWSCRSKNTSTGTKNPFYGKTHTEEVRKLISRNMTKVLTGKRSRGWKGGSIISGHGYKKVFMPEHPNAVNGYVLEHRMVAERMIGRLLTEDEVVHHKNCIRDDNRPENLLVMSNSDHCKLHNPGKKHVH